MGILWMILLAIVSVVSLLLIGLKIYLKMKMGICTSTTDLTGKTVMVTGANTGIGYWTALDLARRNARVILACRNRERGQAAAEKIRAATNNDNVCVKLVDLSVMKSVREFADEIMKTEDRLDILVNNAGMSGLPTLTRTEEGNEEQFAANYLGPFLLTNLLLDKLKQSAPSRIVNVSSMAHKWAKMPLDFDNFNSEKDYNIGNIYFTSKLGNVLFTRELARRLEGTGVANQIIAWFIAQNALAALLTMFTDVTTYALHPGPVATKLLKELWSKNISFLREVAVPFMKTAEEGAQTSIYCAVSDEVKGQSGKYYQDCHEAEGDSSAVSKDMGLAKKLWEWSERTTGLIDGTKES